ncbi:ribonuclease H-like domain-containing protein [Caldisalinibacter kiritimatiensis]|uniref:YprB ribonuclease H-like domain-containing protein n=1 Tax=Caldisalinibacter kiritimatiensis TaxID=1304284 RepID=R1AU65_9FIRM|nr:ribonuclease H-like domain-containing protein [Caldisalinibacter kiritimatiensis]EOD00708.1 hypothetical protein L21TH_1234 [Caldisalinibacter kiritimatiensis]
MEVIHDRIPEKIYISSFLKKILDNKNFCILDIETTGLNKKNNPIILIGLLYEENSQINIMQFFADHIKEEKKLLESFKKVASKFNYFITYNGDTFDIPFINFRLNHNSIDYNINSETTLDILKVVRKHKDLLELPNCKLKTVEKTLGINREDKISGKESIKLYYSYIKQKDLNIKKVILKHNYDDIYYLSKLLSIYDVINNLATININTNLKGHNINIKFDLNSLNINGDILTILGKSSILNIPDQIYYGENYNFGWKCSTGNFKLNLQVYEGMLSNKKKCIYFDKNECTLNIKTVDKTQYRVPENIILIKENKKLIKKNFEPLLKEIIKNIFSII